MFFQNTLGSITYVLSTHALLTSVGVGVGTSLPFAAAISWVLKDGLGASALVLFASKYSTFLDFDLKRFKFRGDILHNFGVFLEMCTPFVPGYFLPLASVSNLSKGIAGLIYGATRASLNKSFALKENLGDITAKYQSQGMAAYLTGMALGTGIGLLMSPMTTVSNLTAVFSISIIHMLCSYKSLKSIDLKTLNMQRATIVVDHWLRDRVILPTLQVNKMEKYVDKKINIQFGASIQDAYTNEEIANGDMVMQSIASCNTVTQDGKYAYIIRRDASSPSSFKVCKKELFYTNLKINSSAEELLKASKTLFAYPSSNGGGSCLCVSKLTAYGKAPDTPFCLKGHTDPITCFEFSPFNDQVVATGSRDCTVKLWSVDDDAMAAGIVSEPLLSLPKQNKRITGVYYHPSVDSLFMSATSDHIVDLWDLSAEGRSIQRVTGATDLILSLSWNTWSGGNMFATSSRDKHMRLYDPRAANLPVADIITHEGAQGFKLVWADANGVDLLCTVGANKSAQRQLYLWDPRALTNTPLSVSTITTDSSVLTPYYDYATNLLYLGGKGDGIYQYELDRTNSHLISKASFGNNTQSAVALLPKSVCDVQICEIDRFLRLTNNTIEMVSFMVPRKSPLFQEDIFPPAPCGDPTTDVGLWFSDPKLSTVPVTVSMQPEGLKSIYEVPEEDGGKSKQKDKLEQLTTKLSTNETFLLEGDVKQEVEGWLFNTYQPRYLKIVKDRLYCFLNEDAAQSLWDISMANIKYVDIYDSEQGDKEWLLRFNIILNSGKEHKMECQSVDLRDAWITSINAYREMALVDVPQKESPTLNDFHLVSPALPSPAVLGKGDSSPPATSTTTTTTSTAFAVPGAPASANVVAKKTHSVLSRNPSYTSLKLSGGMAPPPSASPTSSTPSSSTPGNGPRQIDIVIEGSLIELVPGILWNSNVEKWYIVSDGMLYSFKSRALKTGEPIETIHLEKAISVHKTKEIFKIEGFSFQLTTPSRIIHLLSKNKDEMKSWVSVLRANLKSSGESIPGLTRDGAGSSDEAVFSDGDANEGGIEQDEEEPMLEGQINRKMPGIFSMWGGCFMSLLAEDLFLSKNKLATQPDLRIQLSTITAVKKSSPTEFALFGAANTVVCSFRTIPPTDDYDDCTRWVEGIEAARKRSIDVIKMFGLSEKDDTTSTVDDEARYFLDLTAVKSGRVKMLMQIKGKRKIRAIMANPVAESLNTHNSFVLDAGARIFVWTGVKSSRVNRAKALDLANRIRTKERGGKATLVQLDEGRDDNMDFWECLGGRGTSLPRTTPTPDEQDTEFTRMSVYRIGIDVKKNSLRARLAWEGSDWRLPAKELLHTKFVYVVDCMPGEIYIWIGKESASQQRRMGVRVALALVKSKDRADWTRITRITEFGESNLFKEKFANYPGMLPISTSKMEIKNNVATSRQEHKLSDLVGRLLKPAEDNERIFTNASAVGSRVKVWKIEDYEKIDHPETLTGQFFGGDSYIVLYTYMLNNKEAHVIYYYLGRHSSINDKGTSAYLTVDLHDSLGGTCVQVRVVQNKECRNFLNLFRGKMVIHAGKYLTHDDSKPALFEVRGKDEIDVRSVQVDLASGSLNSQHVYILRHPSTQTTYIWQGKYSLQVEKDSALSTAQSLANASTYTIEAINETQEPEAFWAAINGRAKYFNDIVTSSLTPSYHPRLFVCSNSSGINEILEEQPYSQDDLEIGNVVILDVQSKIYIWLGTRSPHRTKKVAMEVLIEFCKLSAVHKDAVVLIVEPYEEPAAFKSYFRAWCTNKYPKTKLPVQERAGVPVESVLKDYLKEVYSYEELLADPMPAGVDATRLEIYLPDDEFVKIFNMTRKDWEKIPTWRREGIKKSVFLF
eukprot:gene1211-1400_t